MTLYFEIDLHSNKYVICIVDDKHKRLLQNKLDNDPEPSIRILSRYEKRLKAIGVGSTLNRYWLVDALINEVDPSSPPCSRNALMIMSKKTAWFVLLMSLLIASISRD